MFLPLTSRRLALRIGSARRIQNPTCARMLLRQQQCRGASSGVVCDGLCTCERVVYRHGAILLILRVRRGFSTRWFRPHGG